MSRKFLNGDSHEEHLEDIEKQIESLNTDNLPTDKSKRSVSQDEAPYEYLARKLEEYGRIYWKRADESMIDNFSETFAKHLMNNQLGEADKMVEKLAEEGDQQLAIALEAGLKQLAKT